MNTSSPASIDLAAARRRIQGRVHKTPLLHSTSLDQRASVQLWLKAESFQRGGSFKTRGAFNALLSGLEQGDHGGILAVSSGNHGQAVALAARELGLAATVVMPQGASSVKVAAVRGYGAEVVTDGVTGENREDVAAELAATRGLRPVHPHNDELVIAGQSTVAAELVEQCAANGFRPDLVLVPVGGGGLLAGVALAVGEALPGVPVVGVEPAVANDGQQSLAQGRLVYLPGTPATAADGARTLHLGQICWDVIRARVERIVTVSESEIAAACWWLWTRCKLVVEPTGAMTTAAALRLAGHPEEFGLGGPLSPTAKVVCIVSGGNCTPDQIAALLREQGSGESLS
ncbi:MAG: threonine/serine dehydratase [Candidatus Dormibacteraeota bacterium]|nr:threonine/serine dehydratase [Candidatus Dormibacteraeota bacterium]